MLLTENDENLYLSLAFDGDHHGKINLKWLRENCYSAAARQLQNERRVTKPHLGKVHTWVESLLRAVGIQISKQAQNCLLALITIRKQSKLYTKRPFCDFDDLIYFLLQSTSNKFFVML